MKHPSGRLVVVSNRLPYTFRRQPGGGCTAEPASGGLVTALLPVMAERGGAWIGWPGSNAPLAAMTTALAAAGAKAGYQLVGVPLAPAEVKKFYQGFSNEIVWPLFHELPSLCNFDPEYWKTYVKVNRKYARAINARGARRDFVWVHDYHLMNVAVELRRLGCEARCGFFLHIPFPPPDLFLKLPWRRELARALLEFDLIGFQTARDQRNFVACARELDVPLGRARIGHFPISIDYDAFCRRATREDVAARARELHRLLPGRRLVLGVDRLDYTKGLLLRLRAFQHLLETRPEMRGRVSLLQVVVPSREDIGQYKKLRTEIEQLAGKINGAYARPGGWVPVWYEYRSLSRLELLAYYRAADIALITPLRDGMNLVAKEYCACSIEEDCALILSEFAGAAAQLANGALLVNPYDIEGVAEAIRSACLMRAEERRARMRRMRRAIRRQDVYWWVNSYLAAAAAAELAPAGRAAGERDTAELQIPV